MPTLTTLLTQVRACTLCAAHLPLGPRPVVQARVSARLLIAGQAPGRKVHETGVPFNDASGDRLRAWLKRNPWFEAELRPFCRGACVRCLVSALQSRKHAAHHESGLLTTGQRHRTA
jgi:uracil-DNA glycosylase